jgi:hypothetical protein
MQTLEGCVPKPVSHVTADQPCKMTRSVCRVGADVQTTLRSSRSRQRMQLALQLVPASYALAEDLCAQCFVTVQQFQSRAALQSRARKICYSVSTAATVSGTGRAVDKRLHICQLLAKMTSHISSDSTAGYSVRQFSSSQALRLSSDKCIYTLCDRTHPLPEHLA